MKRFLLFGIFLLTFFAVFAQGKTIGNDANGQAQREPSTHVTAAQAMDVGYAFMHTGSGSKSGGTQSDAVRKQAMQLVYTGQTVDSVTGSVTDCYYVFALQPKGFVIVAADDRVEPILGYSYDNNFVVEHMPEHVRGWFGDYEKQIQLVAKSDQQVETDIKTKWSRLKSGQPLFNTRGGSIVGPLLTTTWNQAPYYNALCPEDDNSQAVTGCVATAMAQIINYWGYPDHGRGIHSYDSYYFGTQTVNYDSVTYDYANMPVSLSENSTLAEINAVATLMYHCGVAANMQYSYGSSGAFDVDARAALINFFRFSPNLSWAVQGNFTLNQWQSLLRENLDANQPVMYGGGVGGGGHNFVCDGYDDNDFFHFNFGWGGACDGWYLTYAINPNGNDFNSNQSALVGIVPDSTGNVILGQMDGTSIFTIENPLEFCHLLGCNAYTGPNYINNCNNTVILVSADTTKQLVSDVISFESQNITIYDSVFGNQLAAFSANAGDVFDPVVSTTPMLTFLYQGTIKYTGFKFVICQNSDCRMVSRITSSVDTNTVHLAWHENGNANQWQVEYGLKGFTHGQGTLITASDTMLDIFELMKFKEYDFYIRPVCGTDQTGPWSPVVTVMPEARYWTEVVTSQPEGYVVDEQGNVTIYSAEGLAWLSKLAYGRPMADPFFVGRKAVLANDINLGRYKWKPIGGLFGGEFDGQGYIIDSMYCIEGGTGLFDEPLNAVIKNVNMTNCYSKSTWYAGGIAKRLRNTNVTNCFVSGRIEGYEAVGGITAEELGNDLYITNCAVNCEIKAKGICGGIVGRGNIGNGNDRKLTIRNCYTVINTYHAENITWYGQILGYGEYATMENCYSYIDRTSSSSDMTFVTIGSVYIDDVYFTRTDSGFYLLEPLFFEQDNQYYSNLKEVLNAGVRKFNFEGLRLWKDDTLGINDGLPLLDSEYVVTCPNIQNLVAKNVVNDNGEYGVELSWREMGNATTWEIEFHEADSLNSVRNIITSNPDTLWGLTEQTTYVFRVRPICGMSSSGGWSEKYTLVVDRPYWTDVVVSQPEGYSVDEDGNVTISSAEGLAWLSSVVNGLNGQIANDFDDKTVILIQDVTIGKYKWTAINGFKGTFNGGMHTISGLYVNELTNCQGLFGNVPNGTYMNVNIDSANVRGGGLVGILVGQARLATIVNCHVSGTVYGETMVGGLVGNLANSYTVNSCSSMGVVQAIYDYVGGLIGDVGSGIMVDDDIIYTSIRNNYSGCTVVGGRYATGGLIGEGDYIAENCYAIGNVYGYMYNGGVAGSIAQHWSYMRNCYSAGLVNDKSYSYVVDDSGVIRGFRFGSILGTTAFSPTISNCYGLADPIIYWDGSTDTVLIGISDDRTSPMVSNIAAFTVVDDSVKILKNVTVGQANYDNLLDALNAWVDTYDTTGMFLHWMTDTTDENNGFPVFDTKIRYNTLTLFVADSTPYGTVNGAGNYSNIEPTIIKAIPDYGYHFVCWNDGNPHNPRGVNLTQDTTFTAIFEKNLYGVVGDVVVNADFHFDFEDSMLDNQWTLLNGDFENRWCINTLDNSNRTLFVSNDNGISNTCTFQNFVTNVYAYTTMILDAGNYNYDFDWRAKGQGGNSYLRVALMPSSKPLNPNRWLTNSLPDGAIALDGGSVLNEQTAWQHRSGNVNVPAADEYRLVFQWRSSLYGSNPPAAIDNIHFSRYDNVIEEANVQGDVLGSDTVPYLDTVMLTAVPYEGYRFSHWTDGNTDNPRVVLADADKFYWAVFECAPYDIHDSLEVCGAYTWQDSLYTISTLFVESLISQAGCDSVVTHHLTVNPIYDVPLAINICEEDLPYHYINGQIDTIFGKEIPSQSTSIFHLSTVNGCDSVVTLYLTINHATNLSYTVDTCDWYRWNDSIYRTSGTYTYTHEDANGCTQVDTLHLTIGHSNTGDTTAFACNSFTWYGETYTETPEVAPTHIFTNTSGCDSVVTLHLTIGHSNTGDTTAFACNSFTWYGETYTETPEVAPTHTFTNASGCDSVVTLHLAIGHSTTGDTTAFACNSFTWYGETYTETPEVSPTHTFTNASGCDSVVTLHLTIGHSNTGDTTAFACNSFTWYGETYTETPEVSPTHTFTNASGCDSVVTLHLTIGHSNTGDTTAIACNSFTWYGETYTETPDVAPTHTFTNASGCDSVVTLHLTINIPVAESFEASACESYVWNDSVYTESGDYTQIFPAANGCDSVVTLHLTINHSVAEFIEATSCDSYTWNDSVYTESGNYTQIFPAANGCDSVVILLLTINSSVAESFEATACESYTWNDSVYTESGDYTQIFSAANDCDSVVTLHLTIKSSVVEFIEASACESYTWNDSIYTESGNYTQIFPAANGCDSVVILQLTINYSVAEFIEATACESYTWNDSVYTESGNYTQIFPAANGCDSVVILQLTINYSVAEFIEATACESYTWNDSVYTESGDYTQIFSGVSGCDSVVTLHLTINHSASFDEYLTLCENELPYHYVNGQIDTTFGIGTPELLSLNYYLLTETGCDSVVTLHLTINTPVAESFEASACESYAWNDSVYTESGDYTQIFPAANGCDSVVTLHLTVNHSASFDEYLTLCENELPYHYVNGQIDTTFGIGTPELLSINYYLLTETGCDSVVTLHLTVNPSVSSEAYLTISENDLPFTYGDTTFMPGTVQSGDYTFNFTTADGCDSVIILHLTVETGINDYALNTSMKVYPNPTKDVVNVQLTMNNEQLDKLELQLFDVYGRLLNVVETYGGASHQTTQIDLSQYAKGVYFVKAVSDSKTIAVRKVVKD